MSQPINRSTNGEHSLRVSVSPFSSFHPAFGANGFGSSDLKISRFLIRYWSRCWTRCSCQSGHPVQLDFETQKVTKPSVIVAGNPHPTFFISPLRSLSNPARKRELINPKSEEFCLDQTRMDPNPVLNSILRIRNQGLASRWRVELEEKCESRLFLSTSHKLELILLSTLSASGLGVRL